MKDIFAGMALGGVCAILDLILTTKLIDAIHIGLFGSIGGFAWQAFWAWRESK